MPVHTVLCFVNDRPWLSQMPFEGEKLAAHSMLPFYLKFGFVQLRCGHRQGARSYPNMALQRTAQVATRPGFPPQPSAAPAAAELRRWAKDMTWQIIS
jgi:hypothetical protein